ncbi:ABC transporter permease [Natrarchaeobius oligotrophus]|uniref:ABC transporter permease n=1 Tax=Natrarchaeobius chitinivorans TaxID=1679083 RepID=A0A3N6PLK6_NATCH|nr:ABC transporter permease [Natrarchaeobius chitinivorans]RQH02340.1 ABC transporter permease [Natrarchaeobius chitinivorans]
MSTALRDQIKVSLEGIFSRSRISVGLWESMVGILIGILLWEWYATDKPVFFFPGWFDILDALSVQFAEGELIPSLQGSLQTLFLGFFLAVIVGVPLGLSMGMNERLASLLNPYINALYVAPISALVPIIILVGGASFESRVAVVFLFAIFEITITTYEGARTTPNRIIDVAKSFGASRYFIFRRVVLPYDLPYIFAGMRLGVGRAVKGMILAELLISWANLGAMIRTAQNNINVAGVLSIVLLLMILGLILTFVLKKASQYLTPWQPEVNV